MSYLHTHNKNNQEYFVWGCKGLRGEGRRVFLLGYFMIHNKNIIIFKIFDFLVNLNELNKYLKNISNIGSYVHFLPYFQKF